MDLLMSSDSSGPAVPFDGWMLMLVNLFVTRWSIVGLAVYLLISARTHLYVKTTRLTTLSMLNTLMILSRDAVDTVLFQDIVFGLSSLQLNHFATSHTIQSPAMSSPTLQ